MESHIHEERQKIFECFLCDKTFKYKKDLEKHRKEIHTEEKHDLIASPLYITYFLIKYFLSF